MDANTAIRLKDITKTFGPVVANDKISLEVDRGEILALLGENGSGKTTLMNMLSGIYFPDAGQIWVDGKEVTIRSPRDAFDLGIGMIHQHFKLVDVLTAAENIVLGLDQKGGLDRKKVAREVRAISEKYGFDIDPDQKIYNMSVSQKQGVEILKVLYRGADILILDEVLSVGDGAFRRKSEAKMKEIIYGGATSILVSHSLEQVREMCTKILWLHKGHQVEFGDDVQGICDRYQEMLDGKRKIEVPAD